MIHLKERFMRPWRKRELMKKIPLTGNTNDFQEVIEFLQTIQQFLGTTQILNIFGEQVDQLRIKTSALRSKLGQKL